MRTVAVVLVLATLCGCSKGKPSPGGAGWTVESVLFRDVYTAADGYAVDASKPGLVLVTRDGREVVRYVGVGSEVVKVTREE